MTELEGNILKDGQIFLSSVKIFINEHQSDSGLKDWDGYFESEESLGLSFDGYEIELSDGRKGKIVIVNISHDVIYIVNFSGNGPLSILGSEKKGVGDN